MKKSTIMLLGIGVGIALLSRRNSSVAGLGADVAQAQAKVNNLQAQLASYQKKLAAEQALFATTPKTLTTTNRQGRVSTSTNTRYLSIKKSVDIRLKQVASLQAQLAAAQAELTTAGQQPPVTPPSTPVSDPPPVIAPPLPPVNEPPPVVAPPLPPVVVPPTVAPPLPPSAAELQASCVRSGGQWNGSMCSYGGGQAPTNYGTQYTASNEGSPAMPITTGPVETPSAQVLPQQPQYAPAPEEAPKVGALPWLVGGGILAAVFAAKS